MVKAEAYSYDLNVAITIYQINLKADFLYKSMNTKL